MALGTLFCRISSVVAALGTHFFWLLPLSLFAQFPPGDLLDEQSALEPLSRGHDLEHTLGGWSQIICSANVYE